jgi:lipoprotein-anchoring transpeptidase ErfK/SrfK
MEAALDRLVAAIQGGQQDARDQAGRLLERDDLPPDHRARLQQALGLDTALPGDLDGALARLGTNNAFLHSAEGRRLGQHVLELARGLPDDRANTVLTDVVERCMRGPIGKQDAPARAFVDQAYAQLRVRADRFLCDPANLSKARSHTVAKGDTLGTIAKRFRRDGILVDEGSLAILNRIHNPNAIQVGHRIRVPVEPLRAVVEKRSFLMAVYLGSHILRLYWIGHGVDGKTPVAEFQVAEKLVDPDWYAPDGGVHPAGSPENILGRYFVKFSHPSYTGFGAHGTPMPETICTESSMGCIRMYDKDIEEVYRLLPRGAKVEVRDSH